MKISKKPRRQKQNTCFKAFWRDFLIGVMIILILLPCISAFNFDNVKDYDSKTKTITITNAFGLGKEISKVKLNTPGIYYVIPGKDRLVAELEITNHNSYSNVFNEMEFYNTKKQMQKFNRELTYKYKTWSEQKVKWVEINKEAELPEGKIVIGIFTDVLMNEKIEWIPTLFGIRINEWAIWDSTIYNYWAFDENTGTNVIENVSAINNLTVNGGNWTTGILDAGYKLQGATEVQEIFNTYGNTSYSINLWVNAINYEGQGGGSQRLVGTYDGTYEEGDIALELAVGATLNLIIRNQTDNNGGGGLTGQNTGEWQMYTIILNSTTGSFYHNGSLVWNDTWTSPITFPNKFINLSTFGAASDECKNVSFDEVGLWTRDLTPTEVSHLYNSGDALKFEQEFTEVILNTPVNNSNSISGIFNFNCSAYSPANLVNISLYNNGTGTWKRIETKGVTGNSNESIFTDTITTPSVIWSCEACDDSVNCFFADENRTINKINFRENEQGYSSSTLEGSSEKFTINISINTAYQPTTMNLIYNNTVYVGTSNNLGGGNYTLTRILNIPGVTSSVNNTFLWSITLTNGINYNSSTNNQTVNNINIDDCSAYSFVVVNYTLRDEENKSKMNGAIYNSSIEIDLNLYPVGSSTASTSYSQNYSKTNNALVCLENDLDNAQYEMDVQTRYVADGYSPEFHHIQNFSLINSTLGQEIDLYDLKSTDAQRFLVTYKDSSFLPVANVLIDIQRKYVSEGIFRSVEIPKTDDDGQAIAYFDLENVAYTVIVSRYGEILSTFDNIAVVCQDQIIGDCRLNLQATTTGEDFPNWDEIGSLSHTMVWSEALRKVTVVFSTTDGSSRTVLLNTTKFDRFQNQSVCSDSITSSSGTLTCTVPGGYGNITVVSELYSDGELVRREIYKISESTGDIFGINGILMMLILLITLPLMMTTSTIGVILGVFVGLIMGSLLMLYDTGSILGAASVVTWAILAGVILIWKIARRGT